MSMNLFTFWKNDKEKASFYTKITLNKYFNIRTN
jgi:hypothetical protein